jgi:branched-chain amino acid transport system substrate-binding protein
MAIYTPITEANIFLISPNAGPAPLTGKGCSPFFFSTSYQNDQPPEILGTSSVHSYWRETIKPART